MNKHKIVNIDKGIQRMDKGIQRMVDLLNTRSGISTTCSCEGHVNAKRNFNLQKRLKMPNETWDDLKKKGLIASVNVRMSCLPMVVFLTTPKALTRLPLYSIRNVGWIIQMPFDFNKNTNHFESSIRPAFSLRETGNPIILSHRKRGFHPASQRPATPREIAIIKQCKSEIPKICDILEGKK